MDIWICACVRVHENVYVHVFFVYVHMYIYYIYINLFYIVYVCTYMCICVFVCCVLSRVVVCNGERSLRSATSGEALVE